MRICIQCCGSKIRITLIRIWIRLITLMLIRMWIRILIFIWCGSRSGFFFNVDAEPGPTFHPDADPDPEWTSRTYFRQLIKKNLGLKYLNCFEDPDPRSLIFLAQDPGWKRDKHPGSATPVLPSRSTVQRSPCPRGRCTSGPGRSGAAQS